MTYNERQMHETEYPDVGVTAVAGLRCDDCNFPMEEHDRWDYMTDTKDFICPGCGKVAGLDVPTSGDVQ